ncbi:hypothetical protein B484DRAFT_418913, partial [Ochromonadaceae sp. CCMP2298]
MQNLMVEIVIFNFNTLSPPVPQDTLVPLVGALRRLEQALREGDRAVENADWEGAVFDCVAPMAAEMTGLGARFAGTPPPPTSISWTRAGAALESAAEITGCIVMASAAGPSIQQAGEALEAAGGGLPALLEMLAGAGRGVGVGA